MPSAGWNQTFLILPQVVIYLFVRLMDKSVEHTIAEHTTGVRVRSNTDGQTLFHCQGA